MPRGISNEVEHFVRYLQGVVLKEVDTSDNWIQIKKESDWQASMFVALIHDGSGYTPVAGMATSDRSGDEALQTAYAVLEDAIADELTETRKDLYAEAIEEGLDEDAAQQRADEWSQESWDGSVWQLTNKQLYDAMLADKWAKEYVEKLFDIDIEEEEAE